MRKIPLFVFVLVMMACGTIPVPTSTPAPTLTAMPTFTPTITATAIVTPNPTATLPPPDTGWIPVQPGLEQRGINVFEKRTVIEHIFLLRVDPGYYDFKIAYDPQAPKGMHDWQQQTGAQIVLNGGYFRIEDDFYIANGLLVVEGLPYGQSYDGYGGMFTVSPEGAPRLRSLRAQPFQPGEEFRYALQSFPLLVAPGGVIGFPAEYEDNMKARRSVIGRDIHGRFVLLVTTYHTFTLHQMSKWLVDSDLQLDIALNLDGGPSSGLVLAGSPESVFSISTIPVVIAITPR